MRISRTKLYQEKYFDIRSYELEKVRKKEDIFCMYGGKTMTLTPKQQKQDRLLLNKAPIKSKINPNQTYMLYSYLWKPDKPLTDEDLFKMGVFG